MFMFIDKKHEAGIAYSHKNSCLAMDLIHVGIIINT